MSTIVCSHIGKYNPGDQENQASNVKKLIDAEIGMIEIDIQITKDGVPVLFHDTYLSEKTNKVGQIKDYNWETVKNIKYKRGEGISRLDEVLKYHKQKGSKSIIQLDKCDAAEISIINNLGLFKGIEQYILAKGFSFTPNSAVKNAGIKWMPIIPSSYVGKMNKPEVIAEIVQKSTGYDFLEGSFSEADTLFIDGTLAKELEKVNCKLLIIGIGGGPTANPGAPWSADNPEQWARILSPMRAGAIMTNKPIQLKEFLKTYVPPEPKPEEPKPEQAKPAEQVQDEKAKQEADKQSQQEKLATEARLVNSKITLKKKSGPGEIVGVVEGDLYLGNVTFNGLQFTQPGEYVISVIGSSNQLEQGEFTVIVEPAEEIVEQDPSGQEQPISGTRPIIAQIDKPTIKLGPIIPNVNGSQPNNDEAFDIGNLPLVFFGSFQIRPSDIKILQIFYDEFVPKCYLTFQDSFGQVNRPETAPTANSTIDIFLNSGSEQLKSIHLRFLIDQKKDNRNDTITIFGKLDLRDFYKIDFKSYTGSSFEVLRQVCKELGLGYNSNIVETNDSMKWIRNGTNLETYVRSIISKSYISDSSFMAGYIDYYYCFNYVDVEKEYNRDNTSDIAIPSTGISAKDESPDESKVTFQVLTNDKSQNSTPFYFGKHTFMNNATVQLTNTGATTDSKVYDRVNKRFLKFNVDGMVSPDAGLKTLRSEDDINTNFRAEFTGNFDADNVHENYLYAETQNKRNFENLANIIADLVLPTPNFNIYKFQKIRVYFVNERQTATDPNAFNTRYTGDWIIIDISYTYQKSALYQTVRIARKELTKVESEVNNETTKQDNTQNNEINENEIVDPENKVVPNSVYEVGQEVWLEQNGIMYFIIIENVSENGIEVSGKVKKYPRGLPSYYTGFTPGPSFSQVTPEETPVDNKEPNLDVKTLNVSYVEGDILTANVVFEINGGEVEGTGTASLPPEGKAKQKENAAKAAEINAINKYKAARSVFNAINR